VANARAIDLLCHKKDRVLVLDKMLGLDVCTTRLIPNRKTCFPGLTWIGQAHPVFGKTVGPGIKLGLLVLEKGLGNTGDTIANEAKTKKSFVALK
jgi:hypothetical protein